MFSVTGAILSEQTWAFLDRSGASDFLIKSSAIARRNERFNFQLFLGWLICSALRS